MGGDGKDRMVLSAGAATIRLNDYNESYHVQAPNAERKKQIPISMVGMSSEF